MARAGHFDVIARRRPAATSGRNSRAEPPEAARKRPKSPESARSRPKPSRAWAPLPRLVLAEQQVNCWGSSGSSRFCGRVWRLCRRLDWLVRQLGRFASQFASHSNRSSGARLARSGDNCKFACSLIGSGANQPRRAPLAPAFVLAWRPLAGVRWSGSVWLH